jgi:hypothetical protein
MPSSGLPKLGKLSIVALALLLVPLFVVDVLFDSRKA